MVITSHSPLKARLNTWGNQGSGTFPGSSTCSLPSQLSHPQASTGGGTYLVLPITKAHPHLPPTAHFCPSMYITPSLVLMLSPLGYTQIFMEAQSS